MRFSSFLTSISDDEEGKTNIAESFDDPASLWRDNMGIYRQHIKTDERVERSQLSPENMAYRTIQRVVQND